MSWKQESAVVTLHKVSKNAYLMKEWSFHFLQCLIRCKILH